MNASDLQSLVLWFIPVLLSLTVHEWAHAASAHALGDDTAARLGRLTLNPIPHIDPVGTVLLPVMQVIFSGGVFFAWAKPVPVTPTRFTRKVTMSTGMMIVSAAGPVSNLLLALGAALSMGLAMRAGQTNEAIYAFAQSMLVLNLALAIFNMIPLPPLDGSKVLLGLLPRRTALAYEKIFPYAPVLLIGVFLFGGRLIHRPMMWLGGWLMHLSAAIAG
ncbi:site-2 protease family protein [Vulgatibacter sp.]|uniref:site-2 protease family protein n=1 Tax=Vulgatibacter sp. TaxID=1971226 RepID=UPI0035661363